MFYVYRITCSHPDSVEKYYYGFRQSTEPYNDIYWSSSKYVKLAIKQYGIQYFRKKIIRVYSDRISAITHEMKLHEKFSVDVHPKFFNKSKQTIWGYNCMGTAVKGLSYEEIYGPEKALKLKALRSRSAKRKNNKGKNNPMFGKTHSKEMKEALSESRKGEKHPHFGSYWITNGKTNKKVYNLNSIPESWYKGRSGIIPTSPKGYIWITDGIKNTRIKKDSIIPSGWSKGRTISKRP